MKPKISVIIPVWNAELYLRRCLDSICAQSLSNIEIICVDDASTDNSYEILTKYASIDYRIKIIRMEKNCGESVARNKGLAMACGEYIGSVDNDDSIDDKFYESLYSKAKQFNADIVKGDCWEILADGLSRKCSINDDVRRDKVYFSSQWWTAIYKNSMIKTAKLEFPEDLSVYGDTVFLIKAVICANTVLAIDNATYYYHLRDGSNSSKISCKKFLSVVCGCGKVIDYINGFDAQAISEKHYDLIFSKMYIRCISVLFDSGNWCSFDLHVKKFYAKSLIEFYLKCKNRNALNSALIPNHYAVYKYVSAGDYAKVIGFFNVNFSGEKAHVYSNKMYIADTLRSSFLS